MKLREQRFHDSSGNVRFFYGIEFEDSQAYYKTIQDFKDRYGEPSKNHKRMDHWYHNHDKLTIYLYQIIDVLRLLPDAGIFIFKEKPPEPETRLWIARSFEPGTVAYDSSQLRLVLLNDKDMVFTSLSQDGKLIKRRNATENV